jgi:hypothetical protein
VYEEGKRPRPAASFSNGSGETGSAIDLIASAKSAGFPNTAPLIKVTGSGAALVLDTGAVIITDIFVR